MAGLDFQGNPGSRFTFKKGAVLKKEKKVVLCIYNISPIVWQYTFNVGKTTAGWPAIPLPHITHRCPIENIANANGE
jgi:hypothetical protein